MKYLFLLACRTVRANKWRSAVNIAVIACSVAMVVVTSGLCATLLEIERQMVICELPATATPAEIQKALASDWGMGFLLLLSMFFNGLMLAVAAFSIYGAFAIGIRERAKLMAVLMTVGANDLQKSLVTLIESLILSLVGIPLGLVLGVPVVYIGAEQLTTLLFKMGYPVTSFFTLDFQTILQAVLLGLAAILLASVISIIKTMRRSIIGLAKTTSGIEISLKRSPLDWIMWRLFGKAGELASQNYVNQKRNYRFLSLSFAIAMMLYVGGSLLMPYMTQNTSVAPGFEEASQTLETIINSVIQSVVLFSVVNALFMFSTDFNARKGEFAIFQSIGMSTGMMYKIVVLEWVYRGFYLFLYGLVGSYLINFALCSLCIASGNPTYLINPIKEILIALAVTVILCTVMTVSMISKLKRMNIVETLKAID